MRVDLWAHRQFLHVHARTWVKEGPPLCQRNHRDGAIPALQMQTRIWFHNNVGLVDCWLRIILMRAAGEANLQRWVGLEMGVCSSG